MASYVDKVHDALAETNAEGKFVRTASGFREIISDNHPFFKPAANRYHLYISYACPWANRCLAMLHLKGLQHVIGVTAVHPVWQKTKPENPADPHYGWAFYDSSSGEPLKNPQGHGSFSPQGCEPDRVAGARFIRDLYEMSQDVHKKYSVPVLWDKQQRCIVNNESSEIVRMLNSNFSAFASGPYASHDFYPEAHRAAIDEVNTWVYDGINDGVYKCGFAKSQRAYDEAVDVLFRALDRVEDILSKSRFIAGDALSEADIRLFMTLVRFDEVYTVYFKCNVRHLVEYPNIRQYMREIYQLPGISATIDMQHIKTHYYASHPSLNTYAIVPRGRDSLADLRLPHDRNRFD
eukprot:gene35735-43344_t